MFIAFNSLGCLRSPNQFLIGWQYLFKIGCSVTCWSTCSRIEPGHWVGNSSILKGYLLIQQNDSAKRMRIKNGWRSSGTGMFPTRFRSSSTGSASRVEWTGHALTAFGWRTMNWNFLFDLFWFWLSKKRYCFCYRIYLSKLARGKKCATGKSAQENCAAQQSL